jgi:nucleolar protein 6
LRITYTAITDMAPEGQSKKKEKKALRDAERHKKGKKRKHDEVAPAEETVGEEQTELQKDFIALETGDGKDAHGAKPAKPKKRKQSDAIPDDATAEKSEDAAPRPTRKKRKSADGEAKPAETEDAPAKKGKDRFIVFVGNLPYDATDASLAAHFKKLAPAAIRHRTDPKTKRSKGFAFLEFDGYDRMKTCLKLYHHSMFDPADYAESTGHGHGHQKRKGKGARRINVELTAGGGGKTEGRMEKIKAKNVRLEEQRRRRAELDRKEREKAERKGGAAKEGSKGGKGGDADADGGKLEAAEDAGGMHPSRLARMKG